MPRKPKKHVAVRPLEAGDIAVLADRLRACDRAEIRAALGPAAPANLFFTAIADSVLMSTQTWAGIVNGELACLFGVGPVSLLTGTGRPWLLATDLFTKETVSIGRLMRVYLGRMLNEFPHLENWVFSGNRSAVEWLAKLGFTIHPAQPWGFAGESFHRFEMEAR